MTLYRSSEEEFLFNNFKQLIKDSDDPLLKKDVDYIFSDDNLMTILRCKKMRTDGAFDTVKKMQHIISRKYQDVFKRLHPQTLRHVLATSGLGPLINRDSGGSHILTVDIKHWKPREYSLEDLIITCIMIGFEMAKHIPTQENGMTILANVEGISFSQARQVTPNLVKKVVDIIYNSLPMRFAGIHITNVNYTFQMPLSVIKNFLPPKLRKRLHLHSNAQSLHKHFHPSILPRRFGGTLSDKEAYDSNIMNSLFCPQIITWYDKIRSTAARG